MTMSLTYGLIFVRFTNTKGGKEKIKGGADSGDGFKYSGVGREYGTYGVDAFLEPKAILEPLARRVNERGQPCLPPTRKGHAGATSEVA
jgi:hypothetical protein